MKNRVYKIKDKILVRGNENELTEDEVLVKEENGSVVLKERVNGEVKDIVVKGGEPEYVQLNGERESSAFTPQGLVSLNLAVTENEQSIIVSNEYIEVNMPNFTFDILPNTPVTADLIFKLKKINNNNALTFNGIAIVSSEGNQIEVPVMSYMVIPRNLSVIFLAA